MHVGYMVSLPCGISLLFVLLLPRCLPLNGDTAGRFPTDAAAAVWRSRDVGEIWQEIAHHLPTILTVEVFEHA